MADIQGQPIRKNSLSITKNSESNSSPVTQTDNTTIQNRVQNSITNQLSTQNPNILNKTPKDNSIFISGHNNFNAIFSNEISNDFSTPLPNQNHQPEKSVTDTRHSTNLNESQQRKRPSFKAWINSLGPARQDGIVLGGSTTIVGAIALGTFIAGPPGALVGFVAGALLTLAALGIAYWAGSRKAESADQQQTKSEKSQTTQPQLIDGNHQQMTTSSQKTNTTETQSRRSSRTNTNSLSQINEEPSMISELSKEPSDIKSRRSIVAPFEDPVNKEKAEPQLESNEEPENVSPEEPQVLDESEKKDNADTNEELETNTEQHTTTDNSKTQTETTIDTKPMQQQQPVDEQETSKDQQSGQPHTDDTAHTESPPEERKEPDKTLDSKVGQQPQPTVQKQTTNLTDKSVSENSLPTNDNDKLLNDTSNQKELTQEEKVEISQREYYKNVVANMDTMQLEHVFLDKYNPLSSSKNKRRSSKYTNTSLGNTRNKRNKKGRRNAVMIASDSTISKTSNRSELHPISKQNKGRRESIVIQESTTNISTFDGSDNNDLATDE